MQISQLHVAWKPGLAVNWPQCKDGWQIMQMSFGHPEAFLRFWLFLAGPEACIRVFNLSSTKGFVPERVEIKCMFVRISLYMFV